jgi:hypothetical protein
MRSSLSRMPLSPSPKRECETSHSARNPSANTARMYQYFGAGSKIALASEPRSGGGIPNRPLEPPVKSAVSAYWWTSTPIARVSIRK